MRGSTSCLIDQRGRPWEGDKLGMTLLGLEPLVPREAPRLLVGVPKAAWTWSSSLALCSSPHSSAAGRKVPPGKDTSLIVSADRTLPHTHTHTKTLPKSDSFKSGWEGNPPLPLFFLSALQSTRQNLLEIPFWRCNCCLPTPGSRYLQTADFLSLLLATGSNSKVDQSSKQMRYYLLVPVPAAHNSGWTDCSNYDAFFIHSNESIASLACEQEVTKQKPETKLKKIKSKYLLVGQ